MAFSETEIQKHISINWYGDLYKMQYSNCGTGRSIWISKVLFETEIQDIHVFSLVLQSLPNALFQLCGLWTSNLNFQGPFRN